MKTYTLIEAIKEVASLIGIAENKIFHINDIGDCHFKVRFNNASKTFTAYVNLDEFTVRYV